MKGTEKHYNSIHTNITRSTNSFSGLESQWKDPEAKYRTAPFMVWNGKVTESKIKQHLQELKAQGIGGVFIHPRYGMVTEYLGAEYLRLVKFTVETADNMGMLTWLYDENTYPSGFAGGLVPEAMPEACKKPQGIKLVKTNKAGEIKQENLFKCYFRNKENSFIEIQPGEHNENSGEYYAFYFTYTHSAPPRFAGFGYVDLLMPGVTETFIAITMQAYEPHVSQYFGKQVPGIFTDEPNIKPPETGIRYTPDLFEEFYKRFNYHLEDTLLCLFEEHDNWRKVRFDYRRLLLDLFIERWAKPWHTYCQKNNLVWTGHYWEHGWPNLSHNPDNMAMYAWHQIPCIDLLFNKFDTGVNAQFGNVRIVKELSSTANQFGRKRTLCETYGASGWDLQFKDMLRLGNWMYALGVNYLNQHLSFNDIHGDRKHDFPLSFSAHNSWWNQYHHLGDYFGRLSAALSSGQQINDILVIEPASTSWMYYDGYDSTEKALELASSFQSFITRLENLQIEYDLGSERIIEDSGSVLGNSIIVGQARYKTLVLPPGTRCLFKTTAELIQKLLDNGCTVYNFSDSPVYIEGRGIFTVDTDTYDNYISCENNLHDETLLTYFSNKEFSVESRPVVTKNKTARPALYHHRRRLNDGQILFFTNADKTLNAHASITMKGRSVHELDAHEGTVSCSEWEQTGEEVSFNIDIAPGNSCLYFISNAYADNSRGKNRINSEKTIKKTGHTHITRNRENVLVLDYCDLTTGASNINECYFFDAAGKAFENNGLDGNPWSVSVQFKQDIIDLNNSFKKASGFECTYTFNIDPELNSYEGYKLAVEMGELYTIKVNDKMTDNCEDGYWFDQAISTYDISDLLVPGTNSVSLSIRPMNVLAEIGKIFILGPFDLAANKRGWTITKSTPKRLGSWKWQGSPFYSGSFTYEYTYHLDDNTGYAVKLHEWNGITAAIRVNGKDAGIIAWPPYTKDISTFVLSGKNTIEVEVFGSLRNLLGPHHNHTGDGIVTPWSFRYAPEKMPPGERYQLGDYGLFSEIEIIEMESIRE